MCPQIRPSRKIHARLRTGCQSGTGHWSLVIFVKFCHLLLPRKHYVFIGEGKESGTGTGTGTVEQNAPPGRHTDSPTHPPHPSHIHCRRHRRCRTTPAHPRLSLCLCRREIPVRIPGRRRRRLAIVKAITPCTGLQLLPLELIDGLPPEVRRRRRDGLLPQDVGWRHRYGG